MLGEKKCPFCAAPSDNECKHLALATEARHFVRRCVELSQGEGHWQRACDARKASLQVSGAWTPQSEDFKWLESAFADEFLKKLIWFGGIEYEWRSGPEGRQDGFWVLLWSKEPRRFWWELRDEFERQAGLYPAGVKPAPSPNGPWLFAPAP